MTSSYGWWFRNLAPVDTRRVNILLFTGLYKSQVVVGFLNRQQYVRSGFGKSICETVLVGDLWPGRFGIRSNDSDNANHHVKHINSQTPLKINMKPKNHPIEKERSSFQTSIFLHFWASICYFSRVYFTFPLNPSIRLFAWTSWNILMASLLRLLQDNMNAMLEGVTVTGRDGKAG